MQPSKRVLFSIIIPARNEELFLPKCLESIHKSWELLCAKNPELRHRTKEIIVVLNRCTDATQSIALSADAVVTRCDEKNLSVIRNAGCRKACGDYLITIDADSAMSPNMLTEIFTALSDSSVIGGGVPIIPERLSLGIFCTGLLLAPIALYHRISAGLFFFRRKTFEELGGFDENLLSAEDIAFAKALKKKGRAENKKYKTLWRTYIVTSCRKFDKFGDWYFVRNPKLFLTLLKGTDKEGADKVWYDFKR